MLGNGPIVLPPCVNHSDCLAGDLEVAAFEDGTDGDDGKGDLPAIIKRIQVYVIFE